MKPKDISVTNIDGMVIVGSDRAPWALKLPVYFATKQLTFFEVGSQLWFYCKEDNCVWNAEAMAEKMRGEDL